MKKTNSSIPLGILLIIFGACFFAMQLIPSFGDLFNWGFMWPLVPLGIGVIFFVLGLMVEPPMLIPGTILSGIGSILWVSNTFGLWNFWQLWLLVPALAGIGIILYEIRRGKGLSQGLKEGGPPLLVGIILFTIFSLVFSPFFSLLWPAAIILLGFALLGRQLIKR